MENNNRKNEQLLLAMAKELEEKDKTVWQSMWVIMIVSMTPLLGAFLQLQRIYPSLLVSEM